MDARCSGPADAVECRAALSRRRLAALAAAAVVAAALAFPAAGGSRAPSTGVGRVAIFYYAWFSNPARDGAWAHWFVEQDGAPVLDTAYYPSRGLYSSSNAKVVQAQMKDIADAGIDTVVVSWWGWGSPEDLRLPLVIAAAHRHGLSVAVHLEPYAGRTPASAAQDIEHLKTLGVTDVYVYEADQDPASAWAAALAGHDGVRIFGQTALVGRAKASGFDGVYFYDTSIWNGSKFKRLCAQAHAVGLLCAPSVGPGYDARLSTDDPVVHPRRNGARYDSMWMAAIRARADVVTITSYNEWQEGTQIEPARAEPGKATYDGAWGKTGVSAQRAYLDETAVWAARFRSWLVR